MGSTLPILNVRYYESPRTCESHAPCPRRNECFCLPTFHRRCSLRARASMERPSGAGERTLFELSQGWLPGWWILAPWLLYTKGVRPTPSGRSDLSFFGINLGGHVPRKGTQHTCPLALSRKSVRVFAHSGNTTLPHVDIFFFADVCTQRRPSRCEMRGELLGFAYFDYRIDFHLVKNILHFLRWF